MSSSCHCRTNGGSKNSGKLCINNLREKSSPGPGLEPRSPALYAGAITTKPPRRSNGPS